MPMMTACRIVTSWICLCGTLWATTMAHAGPGGPLEHAPANACLAIYCESPRSACSAFRDSGLGSVVCGEPFDQWRAELTRRDLAGPFHLTPVFGIDWRDISQIADPGALVAFTLGDGSLGAAWLFALSPTQTTAPATLDAAAASFARQGFRESRAQRSGADWRGFAPPERRKSQPDPILFATNSFYGIATSAAAAEAILAVTPEKSLALDPDFKASAVAISGEESPGVHFFLRPFALWEAQRGPVGHRDDTADRLASARRLGFDAIRAVGGRWSWRSAGDVEWELRSHLLAERPLEKAMRLASLIEGPLPPAPDWLTRDLASAWMMRLDFANAMRGFGNWHDESTEPGPDGEGLFDDLLNALRDDPEGVRLDLRKDVFERLGPAAIHATEREDWLYSIEAIDPPALIESLNRYYRGDRRVTRDVVASHHIWSTGERESLFVEGESNSVVSIRAIAIGQGRLLLSGKPERVRAVVAPSAEAAPASRDPQWRQLLQLIDHDPTPRQAARGLLALGQLLAPSYAAAASPLAVGDDRRNARDDYMVDAWRAILTGVASPSELPLESLPPFTALQPAFSRSGAVIAVADDGFFVRLQTLRPAPRQ